MASEFRGRGFSHGAWILDMDAINADLALAKDQLCRARLRAIDAEVIHSLDDYLRADIEGTLAYAGAEGGSGMIETELQNELSAKAWKRRMRWPRKCTACGESFTPDRRTAARCPTCLAERRAPLPTKRAGR